MEIKKRGPRLAWACRHRTLAIRRDLATTGSGSSALCSRMRHLALVAFHASLSALSPTGCRWHVHAHTHSMARPSPQSPSHSARVRGVRTDHVIPQANSTTTKRRREDYSTIKLFSFQKYHPCPGICFGFSDSCLLTPFRSRVRRHVTWRNTYLSQKLYRLR